MKFRLLTDTDAGALFRAFNLAFSQYVVRIQLTEQQFATKLQREGVRLEDCAGAFTADGNLAGFSLTGISDWQGKQTAYNAGTGVIPAYRGKGITSDLYLFLMDHLHQRGVEQCLLEVIDINKPALHIYQNLGFTSNRFLHCFRGAKEAIQVSNLSCEGITLHQVATPDRKLYRSFWDAEPSWQNSIEAVMRSPDAKVITEARLEEKCVGYGIIFKESGGVAQLAVERQHRKQSMGSGILQNLMIQTDNPNITFLNVDGCCKSLLSFLENRQVPVLLKQLEMVRRV